MPSYKLTFFDARARAELARYVFTAAGQEFEDVRVTREDWPTIKPTVLFGQLPILEIDGKVLAQSHTIARYLAKEFNLGGKDNWEQAQCDQYMELLTDMLKEIGKIIFEQDEAKKKEIQKHLTDVVYPKFLAFFENALEKCEGGYLVGDTLTIADLALLDGFDYPMDGDEKVMDSYPKVKAHRAKITAVPRLSEYIKNRKPSII